MESDNTRTTGTDGAVIKKFTVGDVTKVDLVGPGSATIVRGASGLLTVTAGAADFEHLETKATDDSVKVEYHGGLLRNRGPEGQLRYELTVPILEELKASNGLAVEAVDIDSKSLKIELKGGSTLSLSGLRVAEFEAKVADEGRLTVSGWVAQQKAKLSGKSVYQAQGLESEEVEIDASEGSEATIKVGKRLKVKATGGSTVAYTGDGVDLSIQTSDGSIFRHLTH